MLKVFKLLEVPEPVYLGLVGDQAANLFPPHSPQSQEYALSEIRKRKGCSFFCHFNLLYLFQEEMDHAPKAVLILVRDLRDVAVSATYFIDEALVNTLGSKATFDEKLAYVIQGKGILETSVFNIRKQAEAALETLQRENVALFRFEDLCGPEGGGLQSNQEAALISVANLIGLEMDQAKLNFVRENLRGGTTTFRKGEQGSWRKHFKKHHLRLFEQHLGDLNRRLGYQ